MSATGKGKGPLPVADQKRWFKIWTSLALDMDHLPVSTVGVFVRLGCRTALLGTRGRLVFEGGWAHMARYLGVTVDEAQLHAHALKNVSFDPPQNRDGELAVTFKNWHKYQEDSTAAERMKTLRSKKRGEEIRGDKKKDNPPNPPSRGAREHVTDSIESNEDTEPRLPRHHGQHALCSRCDHARARERERLEHNAPMYRPYAPPTPPPPDPFERPQEHQRQLDALRRVKALIAAPAAERRAGLASVAEILAGSAPQHGQNGQPA